MKTHRALPAVVLHPLKRKTPSSETRVLRQTGTHRWRNSGKEIQILETVLYRNILQRFTTGDHRVIGEKEADNRREEESAHRADRGPLESARRLGAGCGEMTYKTVSLKIHTKVFLWLHPSHRRATEPHGRPALLYNCVKITPGTTR